VVNSASYLNVRMASIAACTNEMRRNGIGEQVLAPPARAEL
jgi:hypothetical protein